MKLDFNFQKNIHVAAVSVKIMFRLRFLHNYAASETLDGV